MFKKIIAILLIITSCFGMLLGTASAYVPSNFEISAEGALLANYDTGDIIYSKNADKKLYPASLTKLMTALLLYENTSDLDAEMLTVSEYALNILLGTDSSVGGLIEGETLTARQMLYVLLLKSGNDSANVIAEHVAGNIVSFVEKMNKRAQELGMTSTHFANAHGLHDTEHYTTPNDMLILTRYVLSIDTLKEICYTSKYKLPATNKSGPRSLNTTNLLLLNDGQKCTHEMYKNQPYYYRYAHGVKTGYTDAAGRCLISTASKNGYTYICIVMNCPVYDERGKKIFLHFGDSKALYEWAFNDFHYQTVLKTSTIVAEAPVKMSWDTDFVSATVQEDVSAIVPKASDASTLNIEVRWDKESFSAPIKKGDRLGECDIIYAGENLGTATLVASSDVKRNGVLFVMESIKNFTITVFGSAVFWMIFAVIAVLVAGFFIVCMIINAPTYRRKKRRRRK